MFTIDDCRTFYSQEVRFAASVVTPGLVEAYARVPREKFLGPAPWQVSSPEARALSIAGLRESAYVTVDDPRDLYHNVVVVLDRAKDINNGQPSALAGWIDALALQPGDRAFHLGCGVGYYTAIIAEVVGPGGSVVALELQPDLAARAKENLAGYANVTVHQGDGAAFDPDPCDAMFVNCGVTHPQTIWLERLRHRGRLVVPFTMAVNLKIGQGVMTKIVREPSGYSASMVTPLGIFSGGNLRDPALEPLIKKALVLRRPMKTRPRKKPVAAEAIARMADHGKDVSRFFSNSGKMKRIKIGRWILAAKGSTSPCLKTRINS